MPIFTRVSSFPPGTGPLRRVFQPGIERRHRSVLQLPAKPRALASRVLPGFRDHVFTHLRGRRPDSSASRSRSYPHAFHAMAACGTDVRERAHLVQPARLEHFVDATHDALVERRAGIHEKIADPAWRNGGGLPVPVGESPPRQQRHLDCAAPLRRSLRVDGGIERRAPRTEFRIGAIRELGIERVAPRGIERRNGRERRYERRDPEPGSTHDGGDEPLALRPPDPLCCGDRETGRRPSLGRRRDVEPVMRDLLPQARRRFRRADVKAAIDLARICADDRAVVRRRERQRERRLSGCGRADDDPEAIVGRSGAQVHPRKGVRWWPGHARRAARASSARGRYTTRASPARTGCRQP